MGSEMNMHEAAARLRLDIGEIVGQLESDRTFKGATFIFEESGRKYELTVKRAKKDNK